MGVLEEKIVKLMELPLKYQSGDSYFTVSEVHYGLLKVMPSLSLDEVKASMDDLYVQGRVVKAQVAKNGVYELVYSLSPSKNGDLSVAQESPRTTRMARVIRAEENGGISLVGLMRELDHVEGVLYNFMVDSLVEHGASELEAADASDLRMANGWEWNADDPGEPNTAFAQKTKAHKALANGSQREKLLIGLRALIEGRIAALHDEKRPDADDDGQVKLALWVIENGSRVDELERLLVVLREMELPE